MFRVRINAKSSTQCPALSLVLRTCFWPLVLFGSVAHWPVEGQFLQSPCPNVFSSQFDAGSNQWVGFIQLQGIRIGQLVQLNVALSIGFATSQDNFGYITMAKTSKQTFSDIENNLPALYRIDCLLKNVIPSLLAISVNGRIICTDQKAIAQRVTTINLEHTLLTQMLPLTSGNINGNVNVVAQRPQTAIGPQPVITQTPQGVQTRPPSVNNNSSVGEEIECGKPALVFNRLSLNGIRSPKGQFPWATPIFDTSKSNPKYLCGSTIITITHLVTAAHCMLLSTRETRNPNDLFAMAGMYNIDNFFDDDLQQRIIERIIIHEEFNYETLGLSDSDIALLKVQPLVYNNLVRPICLWSESNRLEDIVGIKGYVSGWGVTEDGESQYPSYVTATVVDQSSCSRNLEKIIPSSSRVFCADGNGSVPCAGDSSNGFVIKRGTKFFLRGILSVGQFNPNTLTCALDKYVVYTDVAPFRYWLAKVVREP